MAFCTNCGATMDPTAHFCAKCGKNVTPMTSPNSPPVSAAVPPQGYAAPKNGSASGVLKVVLIVIAAFVLLGMLAAGGLVYTAYRVRRNIHITQEGRNGSVSLGPLNASSRTSSATDLAHKIGVDVYPGAEASGEANEAQFGKMETATIKLRTNDSVEKVAEFYKARYSKAMITSQDEKFTLVSSDKDGTLTITAEPDGSETQIEIAKVAGLKF